MAALQKHEAILIGSPSEAWLLEQSSYHLTETIQWFTCLPLDTRAKKTDNFSLFLIWRIGTLYESQSTVSDSRIII